MPFLAIGLLKKNRRMVKMIYSLGPRPIYSLGLFTFLHFGSAGRRQRVGHNTCKSMGRVLCVTLTVRRHTTCTNPDSDTARLFLHGTNNLTKLSPEPATWSHHPVCQSH